MSVMRINRADAAPAYHPPLHHGVTALRLQGMEAGPTEWFWVGLSRYSAAGYSDAAPTPDETVYVVLDGELTVVAAGEETTLRRYDSVHLPPGTERRLHNRSGREAILLIIIAHQTELSR